MRSARLLAFAAVLASACGGGNADQPTSPVDSGRDVVRDTAVADTAPAEVTDPSGPPYPIILQHGMGGFGTLKGLPITYFNGVKDDLEKHGETMVFVSLVPPYDTSETRAKSLAAKIDEVLKATGKARVNIIGHSQGGLDARIVGSPAGHGYGDRIATITTIATPHRGSQIADVILNLIKGVPTSVVDGLVNSIAKLLERAVYELTSDPALRAQMMEITEHEMTITFNPKYVDDPRIGYFSYAGRTDNLDGRPDCDDALYPDDPTKLDDPLVILKPMADYLQAGMKKANDGLVTVQSAKWGTFMQCVPADHASEVGQIALTAPDSKTGFWHLDFFRLVVSRVRDRGF